MRKQVVNLLLSYWQAVLTLLVWNKLLRTYDKLNYGTVKLVTHLDKQDWYSHDVAIYTVLTLHDASFS